MGRVIHNDPHAFTIKYMFGGWDWKDTVHFFTEIAFWKKMKQLSQLLTWTQTLRTFPSLLPIGVLVMRNQLFVLAFFLEAVFQFLPFFDTETSKVQVANFTAVRHCVVSLWCFAAIVQHVPRNFAHLKWPWMWSSYIPVNQVHYMQ